MKKYIYLVFFLIFNTSCKEKLTNQEETHQYCIENMVFKCTNEPLGETYFKGKIEGKEFCISTAVDDYYDNNQVIFIAKKSADDPSFTIGDSFESSLFQLSIYPPQFDVLAGISKDFLPSVTIQTPVIFDSILYKPQYYLDSFLSVGVLVARENLPIVIDVPEVNGWNFSIDWSCVYLPGYEHYKNISEWYIPVIGEQLTFSRGRQDNLKFSIEKLEISNVGIWINYDITFRIECDLYYYNGIYYGRLEEGEFKTQFAITI